MPMPAQPRRKQTRTPANADTAREEVPVHHYRPRRLGPRRLHGIALAVQISLMGGVGLALLAPADPAMAQQASVAAEPASQRSWNLPAASLEESLNRFAQQAGLTLAADPTLTAGRSAPAISGSYTVRQVLDRLLAGTGLEAVVGAESVSIRRAPVGSAAASLAEVKVTAQAEHNEGTTEGTGSYTTPSMSTATGLALSPRETPQSVTVLTRQRMDDEGLVTLNDALRATPGLVVNKSGGERVGYYARGFWVGNITYDGLPTSLDTSWYGTDVLLSDLAAYDRVEIVRGAAGLTSGSGDPSAAINLVRKRPTRETQIGLTGSAGNWSRYGVQADVSGSLNEAGTLRARAVASTQDNESFQDAVSSRRDILYLTAEADLGRRTLLTVGASRQENDNTTSWGGLPASADGRDLKLPRSTFLGNDWDRWDKRSDTVFASLEHRFDNGWKWRMAATQIEALLDMQATIVRLNTGTGLYDQYFGDYHYVDEQNSYDLQASGPFRLFGQEHELVLGASHRDGDFDGYGGGAPTFSGMNIHHWNHSVVPKPTVDLSSWFMRSTDRQRSAYATARLNLADPLKLIVGSRLDWYDFQGESQWSVDDYKVNRHLTKYAGLIYDIDLQHSVYASYTDIFKPQNYYDTASELLDPVVGKNYEIGIKGEYFDGRLNASAAVFRIDQEKVAMALRDQTICPTYPGLSCYESAGLVRSQGVDLELQGALTRDWQIGAGYTYVDKVTRKHEDRTLVGTRANTNLPKHQFKLSTLYHLPGESLDGRWRVGGNLSWQSGTYFESTGFRFVQKAYAVAGLIVGYRMDKHLDIQMNVNNLFDKTYYQGLSNGPTSSTAIYGSPRNVMLMAKYTF